MKIVIVSACSAGIASTYMAAEALELAAKKRGHEAHAETQGTLGIENEISPAIAQGADVVILATDVAIQKRERFAGKPILEVGVAEAIRHAEAVILRAEQVAGA
jgi:fructose-specific phosphotransferase system IIB component